MVYDERALTMQDSTRYPRTLLLGAGFSFDFGMPLSFELTELFLDPFTKSATRGLAKNLAANDPFAAGRPINRAAIDEALGLVLEFKRDGGSNYEDLLTQVQDLGDSGGKSQSDRDTYHYVFHVLYDLVYAILYAYQLEAFKLFKLNQPYFGALRNLLSDVPTWAFSLNHDLMLESLAIDEGIPISYGDTGTVSFPISNLNPADTISLTTSRSEELLVAGSGWIHEGTGLNLVRLHGGLAELEYRDGSLLCNPSLKWDDSVGLLNELTRIDSMGYFRGGKKAPGGKARCITGPDGTLDIIVQTMKTGGRKYSKTTNAKKGEEKLQLFNDVLQKSDELLIIGYGLGDKHINDRISNAMVLNPELKIRTVDPKGVRCPPFLEQFDYDSRVRSAYCRAAEWLHYVPQNEWNREVSKVLKEREKLRERIKDHVRKSWLEFDIARRKGLPAR